MAIQIAFVVLGLAVLLIAGDLLVRGAVGLASALKIPALIVSLTVVAFGTSAPEMFVSVEAVLSGSAGIALGNIVGSNIANILLVLGVPALIYPISAHVTGLRRHGVFMLLATAVFCAFAYRQGQLQLSSGLILFAGIILYITYMWIRAARGMADDPVIDDPSEYAESARLGPKILLFLAAGLIGLPAGAHLLVTNAAELAAVLGVREAVIGLTVVAFGTSLPELATVTAAAFHKKSDVAMGGVVGSNIFNLLAVGGVAGMAGVSRFDPDSLVLDMPVMIATTIAISVYIFLRRDIGRVSGALMFLAYVAFIAALAIDAGL
ncbi:calcium/sodium antiporter [Amphiplicatus metriothermophilus]|uniref:Cation:H+ antiporter n=1 Tax=Amphiplicatus metriothermophilus TaxID=1519374 RepID=A0A239PRS8_9PROT|nr:calcium/sodium antiporter [Amphiplicatus metriothermophilus]MBB5518431.1 cation:H+ antiporter [Amphiplicatus metriothermophilus]SNT72407.1 cation:H+ antiporter [Amphiplicatus metriothermophilus]